MAGLGASRPEAIRAALREAARLDREWQRNEAGRDDLRSTPWMPFPLFDFVALVAEALPESAGDSFLELGAGIGTRMLAAREIFGLDVHGIERVEEYANQAWKLGMPVEVADALGWGDYGNFSLLWFNRPFRDAELQMKLEDQVWHDMRPGAVVIAANLESPPPRTWWPVLDDQEVRRWIMQKP